MNRRLLVLVNPGVIAFATLYAASLAILLHRNAGGAGDYLVELVIIGVLFPLLAWAVTPRVARVASSSSSLNGTSELLVVLGLVLAVSLFLISGPQWVDSLLPATWNDSPRVHFLVNIARKLLVFVAVPWLVMRVAFGYRWKDYGATRETLRALRGRAGIALLVVGGAFILFQYFAGGGAAPVRQGRFSAQELLLALPVCFASLAVEAGLVEEFFFRALLQTRLAEFFKSEVTGVALMSLIFGLAHAPGFIFRHGGEIEGLGPNPTALTALAYSIVVLAPAGIVFGVIWARTRNLFLLIGVHAAADLLPNVPAFISLWR